MLNTFKLITYRLYLSNNHFILNKTFPFNIFNKNYRKYTISAIDKSALENYVRNLEQEYRQITECNQVLNNVTEKRKGELTPIIQILDKRNRLNEQLKSLTELFNENDKELKRLAKEEHDTCLTHLDKVNEELVELLIPRDGQDTCDSIMLEVSAGVGGQEAMLFAHELFEMYLYFADYKGWSCEIVEQDLSDIKGLRHGSVLIKGQHVFRYFKYEAGVHRVQRIPATERSGRVHTSTVTVVALPQPKDVDITINDSDLRVETKRASGAGGQHVNTTDSAVRIVHLPTGVAVECQVDRSQIKNKQLAMERLKAKLYERELTMRLVESDATRKNQVRSSYRNEKIRTYNFSQDRVTDHRLQGCNFHNLKSFLLGQQQLENLIHKLHEVSQFESLKSLLNSVMKNNNS